jgi:hypothetical protein
VFALSEGDRVANRIPIELPQYARIGVSRTPAVVVQAESLDDRDLVGYFDLATGEEGIAPFADVELLGTTPPNHTP